jgi:hypothetical protein
MSGLSEAELHVQAMRLVCEALREREQDGLEVDWDVLRQMHDQMDAILQALQHRHRYDSSEIVDLRKDRDHWKQARQDAHEAGELMKAEVETLRQQLGNAQRELSEQGLAHSVEGWQEAADLRKQLNAAQAALTRERLDAEERNELNSRQQKGGE